MSWSYDNTEFLDPTVGFYPGSTVGFRNQIRFLIQDVTITSPLFQDEEIDWIQTQEMNIYMAAAACCETLVSRGGAVKTKRISEFSISYDTEFYRSLAIIYRSRGATYQVPYCGGISVVDKNVAASDPDWVRPKFFRDLEENTGTVKPLIPSATEEGPLT